MSVLSKHVYACILVLCLGIVYLVLSSNSTPSVLTKCECMSLVHDDVPSNHDTRTWCINTYNMNIDTTTGVWVVGK